MSNELKWSEYDFTKIPFDDIVSVGQRTLCIETFSLYLGFLVASAITGAVIVGHMQDQIEKIIDQPSFVSKQLTK